MLLFSQLPTTGTPRFLIPWLTSAGRDVVVESKYRRRFMDFWFHAFPAILKNSLTSEPLNEWHPNSDPRFPLHFPKPGKPPAANHPPPDPEPPETIDILYSMTHSLVLMALGFLLVLNCLCFLGVFHQYQRLKRTERRMKHEAAGESGEEALAQDQPPPPARSGHATKGGSPSGHEQPIPSDASEPYGYIGQVPSMSQPARAPIAPMDALSEAETDHGFGADFLGPNYDPRTKVTRWMFGQQNRSNGGSFDRAEPELIPMNSMVPYGGSGGGTIPRSAASGPHMMMTTALMNPSPFYSQPFQPSVQSDIPYADSRATTPSVANYTTNYGIHPPPPGFNNNLTTNNFNNPRRSFAPSPSNSGTTTLSNAESQHHRRPKGFFPLRNNTVIVQEVDLEDYPNGDSGLVVTDDLEVQSSRPKLVPVKTGTLTRSVGVGDTNSVGNGADGDESLPLLPPSTTAEPPDPSPSGSNNRQGQKVTFADEIL